MKSTRSRVGTALIAVALSSAVTSAQSTIYFSNFEGNNGGWTASGSGLFAGDWQYESNYNSALFVPSDASDVPPAAAFSGTGMWGTAIYANYANSNASSYLSRTFDFSGYSNVSLSFASWSNVFTSFDYSTVYVNGILMASNIGLGAPLTNATLRSEGAWAEESIDLSGFDGLSSVDITFELFATTVVDRIGWYIDDVHVTGTSGAVSVPEPTSAALIAIGLIAMAGRRARKRALS